MQIQFHGAVRTVTGSQHLLTVNGRKILLDCGLYQGSRRESYARNQVLPFDAADVDVMVLSHAHIDHSGNIPNLVKSGFTGDIVCTYATRDLCAIMLRDSAKIQESDVEFVNKKNARKNLPPIEPIYTMEDAANSLKQFVGIGYERPYRLAVLSSSAGVMSGGLGALRGGAGPRLWTHSGPGNAARGRTKRVTGCTVERAGTGPPRHPHRAGPLAGRLRPPG